jgi:phenylacetate-CoA ligase
LSQVEISIIVPCWNEAENVNELAERARAMFEHRGIAGEVVFVDDASTDHTGALIDELAAKNDFVRAVHHPRNMGITAGWQSGVEAARGRYVAVMDGDLQYLPEDVYRLYRQLKYTNADVVQGWRSQVGRVRGLRYWMSRTLDKMLGILFGLDLFDIKSGFFICDRDTLAHMLRRRFHYAYFQTFIIVSAHHKGYRIEQIESMFEDRKLGESFISGAPAIARVVGLTLLDLAKGLVEFRLTSQQTDDLGTFLEQHPPTRPPEPLSLWRRAYLWLFGLLMPLHHWVVSRPAIRYYHELRRTEWLNAEQIRALQERRLRLLIKHAHRHVPYYRERLDALGIDPNEIRTLEDLARLPVLTKDDIRRNLHFDLMSDNHDKRKMLPVTTSGSTGEPLTLYADKTQLELRWATTLRNIEWTGYRFGDTQVRLWHSTLGMSGLQAFKERLDAVLVKRKFFPAFAMNESTIDRYIEFLKEKKPVLIDGYAEAFNLIANYLKRTSVEGIRPKGIISSAQTLSSESREVIEQAFHAKVFDKYGSREFSGIAHECEAHQGHHVNAESYIVEIVVDGRPAKPGETGEVLVTDLNNYCVPLIRYALGDLATATEPQCACGRGLPLIGAVQGRTQAIIIGTNGCFLPGTFFAHLLKDYGHIVKQFQVVQERLGAVTFKVIKGARYSDASLEKILDMFRGHLGSDMQIEVEFVDHIPLGRTGKHYHSVSRLKITPEIFSQYKLRGLAMEPGSEGESKPTADGTEL